MRRIAAVLASVVSGALIVSAAPAGAGPQGDANVSRAVSEWTKTKQRALLHFTAEGVLVEDASDQAAYGRLAITRCDRRELPGRQVCIGASTVRPLDESSFTVEDDLSGAVLQMTHRGRQHVVQWEANEEQSMEPSIRSAEEGRAGVQREAGASGEFYGRSVAMTQLDGAEIQQVVDALPESLPVPFPFGPPEASAPGLTGRGQLAGSSTCWNYKASEKGFTRKMNEERAKVGLAKVRLDPELSRVSRVHTGEMIRADLLHHATTAQLTSRVTNWNVLGENVGVGSTVSTLHKAFMNSPSHKANILFRYDFVGVGVAKKDGRMWVTVTFSKGPNPGTTLKMPNC